jgi:hypothetical protein
MPSKKKLRSITDIEWLQLKTGRGQDATGYPCHDYGDGGFFYFWPWGTQPEINIIHKIGASCPVKAAKAFLEHYVKNPSGDMTTHYPPVKKSKNANQGKTKKGR